jgi:hypothetical protein
LEARELQPGGGYRIVDPRKSFLVPALKAAAEQNGDKYARITVRRVNCAVDAEGRAAAACRDEVLSGVAFTVSNPTHHRTTRSTDRDGEATFGPRAGANRVTQSEDKDRFDGAYVLCLAPDSGRVLFAGRIDEPTVTLDTKPGEAVRCDWYDLAGGTTASSG